VNAADVLADRRCVLLDFDGPVCSVFGGVSDRTVTLELRAFLADIGLETPPDRAPTRDPFDLLRHAASHGDDLAERAEQELTRLEVSALATASPTPATEGVMRVLSRSGRSITIVSNNSRAAVEHYLAKHGLGSLVTGISARTEADPDLLKPNPHLLLRAMVANAAAPGECVMIGDSLADIEAAHASGTAVIAYANKPGKRVRFEQAHPTLIIDSMGELTARPVRPL
jgi:HAD superfamily hydrolase (TIGR01549 family)